MKELKEIKADFKVNHAARMVNLNKNIERLKQSQKAKPSETKNTETLSGLKELLASL